MSHIICLMIDIPHVGPHPRQLKLENLMFGGDFADICGKQFPLMFMWGSANVPSMRKHRQDGPP